MNCQAIFMRPMPAAEKVVRRAAFGLGLEQHASRPVMAREAGITRYCTITSIMLPYEMML